MYKTGGGRGGFGRNLRDFVANDEESVESMVTRIVRAGLVKSILFHPLSKFELDDRLAFDSYWSYLSNVSNSRLELKLSP